VIRSRTLRTWGASESRVAELLADRLDHLDGTGHATIAFLASGIEGMKVRITAKAATAGEVDAVLQAEVDEVAAILGDLVFTRDDQSMEAVLLDLLRERGSTIGTAESLTGGLIASRLTDVPGASDVVRGAIVAYASEVKFDVLGLPEGPVVTEAAARAMAEGACRVLGCDVSLAVTGVAGPASQEDLALGTVHFATVVDGATEAGTLRVPGDRERVRWLTVVTVLDHLRRRLMAA
jgi:nicotinamide-nucleotide amidase